MSSGNFSGGQFAGFANPGGVTIKSAVRTGQFITLALAKGVIFFAAIAGVIAPMVMRSWAIHNFQQTGQQLPMSIDPKTPLTHEAGQLVTRLMASTLISQAFFEGAGFLNLVLLLVTGQIFLVVPALLAVFAIVVQCPRTSTILDRLEPLALA